MFLAASGDTTVNGTTGTGTEEIYAESGSAFISLNGASDTVIGGTRAATVLGGSGHDVYGFIDGQGGGTDLILGFKASDTIVFDGFGSNPIALETVVDGSDVIIAGRRDDDRAPGHRAESVQRSWMTAPQPIK